MNHDNNPNDLSKEAIQTAARRLSNFGAILIGVAVIGVCFAIAKLDDEFYKMVTIGVSSLVGIIGIFLMIVSAVGAKTDFSERNYFLYNKKKKKEMPVSELTANIVRARTSAFMDSFKHRGKLYIGDLFSDRVKIAEEFRVLFCYEILCEIGDGNGTDPKTFLSFGKECADIFYKYLARNDDRELGVEIQKYFALFSKENDNSEEFKSFIASKKQYLEEKMLKYTVENIHKFNMSPLQ